MRFPFLILFEIIIARSQIIPPICVIIVKTKMIAICPISFNKLINSERTNVTFYFNKPARLNKASGFGSCPLNFLYKVIGLSVPP